MSVTALSLPLWAVGAYYDVRTRRVPDRLWLVLGGLGCVASAYHGTWPLALAGSVVLAAVGSVLFRAGGFGGADVKALAVLPWLVPVAWPWALVLALPIGGAAAVAVQRWQDTEAAPFLLWPLAAVVVAALA